MAHPLQAEVERLATLLGVLRWAFARTPPAELVAVVAQDEFTQDVVVCVDAATYLVFDTS